VPNPDDPPAGGPFLLSGNYEYLTEGYYECQDAELARRGEVMPTCADALDAYVVPIALEKASKAGLAVPDWVLTHEYFPVPAVCYGVNPFSRRYAVVREESAREAVAKKLTWNFKYSMCCQRISAETEIVEFRMVAGRTSDEEFAGWADRVFSIFRIPLATVRLLRNGRLELSAIEILPYRFLTHEERDWAREMAETDRG
jgi:RimK-like ATPgrasp N-terminal domain